MQIGFGVKLGHALIMLAVSGWWLVGLPSQSQTTNDQPYFLAAGFAA